MERGGSSTAFDRVPGKAHRSFRISYGLGRPAGVLHLDHGRGQPRGVSLSDAATWFGIEFDESTGHAHSALADARVTAKLLKQVMDGDYRVSPRAQEVRQRWGMGERAQTRLSNKCPELGDLLLKLKAEGR